MGPREDEHWKNVLENCVGHLRNKFRPEDLPLFLDSVVPMVEALRMEGIHLPGERDQDSEMFDFAMENGLARRDGGKVNACRFQGSIHQAEQHLQMWHMDRFVRTA